MMERVLLLSVFASSITGITTAARALDVAPSTPSTQISETLPPAPRDPAAPASPPAGFSNTRPIAGLPGYVFVAPTWRRIDDRNSIVDPASGAGATGNNGIPTSRSQTPVDSNRQ